MGKPPAVRALSTNLLWLDSWIKTSVTFVLKYNLMRIFEYIETRYLNLKKHYLLCLFQDVSMQKELLFKIQTKFYNTLCPTWRSRLRFAARTATKFLKLEGGYLTTMYQLQMRFIVHWNCSSSCLTLYIYNAAFSTEQTVNDKFRNMWK
jgi:hypothetical protein